MFTRVVIALVALVVAFAILGADTPTAIKKVQPSRTSPSSGKDMFTTYCAVCHGTDAKGGGPAVAALKMPPPDLTTMTKRNGGKFPELRVFNTINGDLNMPAHGSKDMPVWGDVFRSMERDSAAQQMRVSNLTKYIESLQSK
jgi:mono/diheme cytochrome c family protein